jgi:hypothetical protein
LIERSGGQMPRFNTGFGNEKYGKELGFEKV